MVNISFISVCKGRLQHLKQTLPLMVAQQPSEIIIVDYGCPDYSGDWVEKNFSTVKVLRVQDDLGFCVARGRNLGASLATQDWFLFIDADIQIQSEFNEWMTNNLINPDYFYRSSITNSGVQDPETFGTVICSRKAFYAAEGFDELFRGWGGEDEDLFARLKYLDFKEDSYPHRFVNAITHDDSERVKHHKIKNKKVQIVLNSYYISAKIHLQGQLKILGDLPLMVKIELTTQIQKSFELWIQNPSRNPPSITLILNEHILKCIPQSPFKDLAFSLGAPDLSLKDYEETKIAMLSNRK